MADGQGQQTDAAPSSPVASIWGKKENTKLMCQERFDKKREDYLATQASMREK
jgi:hypothetical protein